MRFYLIIVELPQKYNFFRRNTLHTPFYFYIHGLQRVWRCLSFSIQRIRCPWLNVCCSQCRLCLVSGIHRCGGWRTRWRRCVGRGDGNGRSWRGKPMRRGCWRCEMKLENGTPWKSAAMARALPNVLILIGYGGKDLRKSRAVMAQTN